jgi:hypothetical protein
MERSPEASFYSAEEKLDLMVGCAKRAYRMAC